MPLEVDVTTDVPTSRSLKTGIADLLRYAFECEPDAPDGRWRMGLRLTTDDEISRLHDTYFSDPTPTDVITFPFGDDVDGEGYLGDVVVSMDTARANAREFDHSEEREIAFVALHGLLHLLGHDDLTDDQRGQMLERQNRLLSAFGAINPPPW